jgi:activating signal cointegrator complex subunit 3
VTRKNGSDAGSGGTGLMSLVKLLIIDECHLLNEDRGPVLEILVARTLRLVESSQQMCRIVGLSATLPNYLDVAVFLKAGVKDGLFHFDASYRPVPLAQTFIGVTEPNQMKRLGSMNEVTYKKVIESIKQGHQVMVFVHSRRDTVKTARFLRDQAQKEESLAFFDATKDPTYSAMERKVMRSRNSDLTELFPYGFGMHHAGMVRPDRSLVEGAFSAGLIKVLVCTATLAWGVNLPAHTVIIKGTQIYNSEKGGFMDVGMLDIMQIFGRAGRPQFDDSGEAILICEHEKLNRYLGLLTHQLPIESQFIKELPNHLNAEIILGTVTNLHEAVEWLSYTYLYTRMLRNPMVSAAFVRHFLM